jgi:methyl-accepting chemotaxis protein
MASTSAETVTSGITETASAAQEVTRNIAGVDRNAHRTAADAEQARSAGQKLADLAEQLRALVGQFHITD